MHLSVSSSPLSLCLSVSLFVFRWWVFIWTTGSWIAGWVWVCCFSMPSSCSALSSSGRCEALRSKVNPVRQRAENLPIYHTSSFPEAKKNNNNKSDSVVVFLVRVSVHLCRIRLGNTVHMQLHKHTLKSFILSIAVFLFFFIQFESSQSCEYQIGWQKKWWHGRWKRQVYLEVT